MRSHDAQLSALSAYMAARRDAILAAWRAAIMVDPKLTSGASLPRAQLHDHIPALLEDFERTLAGGESPPHFDREGNQIGDAAAHGLHRWQQGFGLGEVTRELGRLNECVVLELEDYVVSHQSMDHGVMREARKIWAKLYSLALSASTSQYFKLQQMEATGHISDLERALESLRELESQRAELWRQAAHDLRGNLGVVVSATAGLASTKASEDLRGKFLNMLDRNVHALMRLLEDVTSLARLQGGRETRSVANVDIAPILTELCESLAAMAQERKLFLKVDGPAACVVEADAVKVRRIAQNLVLNAIKYTQQGGVTVSWGQSESSDDACRWYLQVADTGPGFHAGPGAPMVAALEVATEQGRQIAAEEGSGAVTHVASEESVSQGSQPQRDPRPVQQQPGEGIGLSIVKRLCEMLDATVELQSVSGVGTTFRILLPRRYE